MLRSSLPFLGLLAMVAVSGLTVGPTPAASQSTFGDSQSAPGEAGDDIKPKLPERPSTGVGEQGCPPFCLPYQEQHEKFHERYHPKQRHFGEAHNRFHNLYHRRHRGPLIRFRFYYPGDYYDPSYYDPFFYDPYYDLPPYREKLSCERARGLLRHNGYRNVKALDCGGRKYVFLATKNRKRYRIAMSSWDGHITSLKPY
jgi:hypothetical protein